MLLASEATFVTAAVLASLVLQRVHSRLGEPRGLVELIGLNVGSAPLLSALEVGDGVSKIELGTAKRLHRLSFLLLVRLLLLLAEEVVQQVIKLVFAH